jgi:mannose-6-phosphate isomerase
MPLYPLKFRPRYLEKMWGGRKIQTVLGKELPAGKLIGESWEIFDFPPGVLDESTEWMSSEVSNGPLAGQTLHEIIREFGTQLLGTLPLVGPNKQFPALIKYLDASQDLSVQVHPDRAYAAAHPEAHLKCEAWYIVQNDPGARLLTGLKRGVTRDSFTKAIGTGKVESLIETVPVKVGECFYLPSGTVHALGAGILAAEVQTPSDTTFRVFDFNRIDPATGKPRKLHVEQALQCIDFAAPPSPQATPGCVACEFFSLERKRLSGLQRLVEKSLPAVWMVLGGSGQLVVDGEDVTELSRGETILLPASLKNPTLRTVEQIELLEVTFLAPK